MVSSPNTQIKQVTAAGDGFLPQTGNRAPHPRHPLIFHEKKHKIIWTRAGSLLVTFPAPISFSEVRGLKTGIFFERFVGITFSDDFVSDSEAVGTEKTLSICVRGCNNHIFGNVGILTIWGTILEVILKLKRHAKSDCDSLWAPPSAQAANRCSAQPRRCPQGCQQRGGSEGGGSMGGERTPWLRFVLRYSY